MYLASLFRCRISGTFRSSSGGSALGHRCIPFRLRMQFSESEKAVGMLTVGVVDGGQRKVRSSWLSSSVADTMLGSMRMRLRGGGFPTLWTWRLKSPLCQSPAMIHDAFMQGNVVRWVYRVRLHPPLQSSSSSMSSQT